MSVPRPAFLGVVVLTLAGQAVAVGYEVVLAARFGTGIEADALALTLMIVVAAANELGTWISTLFVPQYVDARARDGEAAAAGFLGAGLTAVAAGSLALAALVALAAPGIVALLAPDLAARGAAVGLLRLFAPLVVLAPVSVLLAAALQANDRFVLAGARQLCWYGATVVALVALAPRLGAAAVPVGMVAGYALFCLLLAADLRARVPAARVPPGGAGRREGVARLRGLAGLLLPLALASALNYVNVTFERAIAARLPEGSLAALTYAFRLLNFPVNLLVLNATAMLLPALARHASRDEPAEVAALVLRALRLTLVFTVGLAALAVALAGPLVAVLLERGAFTAASTALTATAVVWYAPGLIGIACAQVLARAYQAVHEVRRLIATGVVAIVLSIALMPALTAAIGFRGLPIATSIVAVLLSAVMLLGIRGRLPGLALGALLSSAWRVGLAGAAAAAVAWAARGVAGDGLAALATGVVAGAGSYAALLGLVARGDARLAVAAVLPALARR